MEQNGRSDHLGINRRRRQARVKSGCRTCKIRKVKCDEARPACHRCVSTGRVCDGYGIWGGGDSYGNRQRSLASQHGGVMLLSLASRSRTADEVQHFEWFQLRTVTKMPGFFALPFWNTLLFQAGQTEPAIWHAIMTLSAVHRREFLHLDNQDECARDAIDDQEQFMLRHYTKAIGHLRSHTPDKSNGSSVRIALIACVVFVCLEYLRGRFRTAETHLQSGLKILSELQNSSSMRDKGIIRLQPPQGDVDDWIVEAFSKLYLQVVLLRQRHQDPCILLQDSITMAQIPRFRSFDEAWVPMERLLSKVLYLTEQFRHAQDPAASLSHEHPSTLGNCQRLLQTELAQWFAAYEASRQELCRKDDEDEEIAYQMLGAYHAMITIIAQACQWPDDESIFDLYTDQFIAIIDRLIVISKIRATRSQPQALPGQGHCPPMSRSVIHIGWSPPLYYTALKCRVHRIRLQAVRLLESSSRREGIWDASITACVARRVIRTEERDFYRDLDTADDFDLNSSPTRWDLSLPMIPAVYRIHDVTVIPPDGRMDTLTLSYRQETSASWELWTKVYDMFSQCWID
ncbi:transcriptional regulator family: Fungal Specific TF [Paecilomyces variotii]|nr:transcriptional regulator family: Fungal Specific TF [Paecilomyces variotii]